MTRISRIGDEVSLVYGTSLPAYARQPGLVPVFGSNGQVGWHAEASVQGPGIVVGRKGSVGEVLFCPGEFWPIDTTYYVANPKGHDWRFLFYALKHTDLTGLNSHSAVPGLNREDAYAAEAWFPARDVQVRIAAGLDGLSASIELEISALLNSNRTKKAVMADLFTRGLRGEAQKETEIGWVPESWRIAALGEVASLERGRFTHRPRNEPRFYGGNTPFVQTGDVVRSQGTIRTFSQSLNEDGVAISRVFPAGTILITIAANIGYCGVLTFACACPDSLVAISPQAYVDTTFLKYWLQTQQPSMDRQAPKGTQKNINIQFLTPWPVVIPNLEEQVDIAKVLDAIDHKITLHQQKRAVLEELFKALLHKLMTGEIDVKDLDLSALQAATEGSPA